MSGRLSRKRGVPECSPPANQQLDTTDDFSHSTIAFRAPKKAKVSKPPSPTNSKHIANICAIDQKSESLICNQIKHYKKDASKNKSITQDAIPIVLIDDDVTGSSSSTITDTYSSNLPIGQHVLRSESILPDILMDNSVKLFNKHSTDETKVATSSYFPANMREYPIAIDPQTTEATDDMEPCSKIATDDDSSFLAAIEQSVCSEDEKLCPSCKNIVVIRNYADHLHSCFNRFQWQSEAKFIKMTIGSSTLGAAKHLTTPQISAPRKFTPAQQCEHYLRQHSAGTYVKATKSTVLQMAEKNEDTESTNPAQMASCVVRVSRSKAVRRGSGRARGALSSTTAVNRAKGVMERLAAVLQAHAHQPYQPVNKSNYTSRHPHIAQCAPLWRVAGNRRGEDSQYRVADLATLLGPASRSTLALHVPRIPGRLSDTMSYDCADGDLTLATSCVNNTQLLLDQLLSCQSQASFNLSWIVDRRTACSATSTDSRIPITNTTIEHNTTQSSPPSPGFQTTNTKVSLTHTYEASVADAYIAPGSSAEHSEAEQEAITTNNEVMASLHPTEDAEISSNYLINNLLVKNDSTEPSVSSNISDGAVLPRAVELVNSSRTVERPATTVSQSSADRDPHVEISPANTVIFDVSNIPLTGNGINISTDILLVSENESKKECNNPVHIDQTGKTSQQLDVQKSLSCKSSLIYSDKCEDVQLLIQPCGQQDPSNVTATVRCTIPESDSEESKGSEVMKIFCSGKTKGEVSHLSVGNVSRFNSVKDRSLNIFPHQSGFMLEKYLSTLSYLPVDKLSEDNSESRENSTKPKECSSKEGLENSNQQLSSKNTTTRGPDQLVSNLLNDWSSLLSSGEYSDVLITTEQQQIRAHAFVFMVRCKLLFSSIEEVSIDHKENSSSVYPITIGSKEKSIHFDVPYEAAYTFVRYIYTGDFDAASCQAHLTHVSALCTKYQCQDLSRYIKQYQSLISPNTALIYDESLNSSLMKHQCLPLSEDYPCVIKSGYINDLQSIAVEPSCDSSALKPLVCHSTQESKQPGGAINNRSGSPDLFAEYLEGDLDVTNQKKNGSPDLKLDKSDASSTTIEYIPPKNVVVDGNAENLSNNSVCSKTSQDIVANYRNESKSLKETETILGGELLQTDVVDISQSDSNGSVLSLPDLPAVSLNQNCAVTSDITNTCIKQPASDSHHTSLQVSNATELYNKTTEDEAGVGQSYGYLSNVWQDFDEVIYQQELQVSPCDPRKNTDAEPVPNMESNTRNRTKTINDQILASPCEIIQRNVGECNNYGLNSTVLGKYAAVENTSSCPNIELSVISSGNRTPLNSAKVQQHDCRNMFSDDTWVHLQQELATDWDESPTNVSLRTRLVNDAKKTMNRESVGSIRTPLVGSGRRKTVPRPLVGSDKRLQQLRHSIPTFGSPDTSAAITPRPNYDSMKSPELKRALVAVGVRPLSRLKARQMLHYIYDHTHPLVGANSGRTSTPAGSSRRGAHRRQAALQSHSGGEDQEKNDLPSAAESEERASLHSLLRGLVLSDESLHRAVLLYQPLRLQRLKRAAGARGIKCSAQQLVNFLDSQCITFRASDGSKPRRRKNRSYKKQAA